MQKIKIKIKLKKIINMCKRIIYNLINLLLYIFIFFFLLKYFFVNYY